MVSVEVLGPRSGRWAGRQCRTTGAAWPGRRRRSTTRRVSRPSAGGPRSGEAARAPMRVAAATFLPRGLCTCPKPQCSSFRAARPPAERNSHCTFKTIINSASTARAPAPPDHESNCGKRRSPVGRSVSLTRVSYILIAVAVVNATGHRN